MKPRLTATSVILSARYYGLFFWLPGKTAIHFLVKKLSLKRSPVNSANNNGVPLYGKREGERALLSLSRPVRHGLPFSHLIGLSPQSECLEQDTVRLVSVR